MAIIASERAQKDNYRKHLRDQEELAKQQRIELEQQRDKLFEQMKELQAQLESFRADHNELREVKAKLEVDLSNVQRLNENLTDK